MLHLLFKLGTSVVPAVEYLLCNGGVPVGNKMCYIYHDCAPNIASDVLTRFTFKWVRGSDLLLVLATIDENDKVTRKSINSYGDLDIVPRPMYFRKVSANQISMFGTVFKVFGFPDEAIGVLTMH
ncbi:MAG TPA: hypothetical protein VGH64_07565 [Puia sp.]